MANIIEGSPTKQFFIDMITRDISIEDAIIDLLDNSIDGANRMAIAAGKSDFKDMGLHVLLCLEVSLWKQQRSMHSDLVVHQMHPQRIIQLADLV